ncbi:putative pre-mRNA-splicing factor cwc26 [Venustampulla echinocandica]|uniref:Putative pre-mRNA-splicing factor cwc26 n=1 Tax=Venustampulla echinocandica TaxID=2656787 RepID=A0A370TBJ8_9HELO|nr:putative pre-mRNA-splicing factor cwc26 [Venustampulla echinocandica]RDL31406.1 putative pre-mRNA-splicing factor cwc26 [Venustampulla echinocandica]
MSLSSYLASKYLNAEPATSSSSSKKRKRKEKAASSGLIIADDDALGWSNTPTQNEEENDGRPITVSSGSAEFRKAKKNAWKVVGAPVLQPQNNDAEADAADKIIQEAAAENAAAMQEDEAPVVDGDAEGVVKMGDGTHAGLQSAAAVARQFEKRKREEAAAWEAEQGGKKGKKKGAEETVYRDATGRRIDLSMRRNEARRELDEQARKEQEEKEAQKGDVQRAMKDKRREELDEARFMPLARTVDDVDMNQELKERDRWNDPAAQFLVKKKERRSVTGKPIYKGAAPPNRYGIRPGHRWDGVDRSNGWEGERFKALNRTQRNKELDFAWQMDT